MATVSGRSVGREQGRVVRCVCRVVVGTSALLIEVVLGRSEWIGGGASGGGGGGVVYGGQDGGGLQACALAGCGGEELGVGVEGWWVVVCGWGEEGEGVCFCSHCCEALVVCVFEGS